MKDVSFKGHGGNVCALYYVHDLASGLLLSSSADRTIKIWDPWQRDVAAACIQTLVGHSGTVTALTYNQDSIISGGSDQTIRIWRPDYGRALLLYPWFKATQVVRHDYGWISSLDFLKGESGGLFVADSSGNLSCYDVGATLTRKRVHKNVHALGITHLLLIPEQNFIVTLSHDLTVRVFDAITASTFVTIENERRCRFTAMAWDSLQQELFLVDNAGYISIYNLYMKKCFKTMKLSSHPLTSISVRGEEGKFTVTTYNAVQTYTVSRELNFEEFTGHSDAVISLYSFDGVSGTDEPRVYSASIDNTIRCWDPYDMSCLFTLKETKSEISCMMHLPTCSLLVSGADDGTVTFWNPDSGSTISMKYHSNTVSCVDIAQLIRNDYILTGGFDGKVGIWDVTVRKTVRPRLENMFSAHEGENAEILCICYNRGSTESHDANTFFTGGNDCIIRVWNISTFRKVAELRGHTDAVTCFALDLNFLFSGSEDRTIRVWNIANIYEPYQLCMIDNTHTAAVRSMIFTNDIGYLISCSFDGTVKVWDHNYDTERKKYGKIIHEFTHTEQFRTLSYAQVRSYVFSVDHYFVFCNPLQAGTNCRNPSCLYPTESIVTH